MYHSQPNDNSLKSSWNRWWLEERASGGLYLHLEGMQYCLFTDETCKRKQGGGGNWSYYDICEGHSVSMVEDVVLVVTGIEGLRFPGIQSAPRGIVLWYLKSDPDTTDEVFVPETKAE